MKKCLVVVCNAALCHCRFVHDVRIYFIFVEKAVRKQAKKYLLFVVVVVILAFQLVGLFIGLKA